jgi:hypothetical protein
MKKIAGINLTLIVILISACSIIPGDPQPTNTNLNITYWSPKMVTITPTPKSQPTETIYLTQTLAGEKLDTPIQVTETPSPTKTYIPYPDSPPLSELTLTREEILELASLDSIHEDSIHFSDFIQEHPFYVFDRSNELNFDCPYECSKQEIKRPPAVLMITMIRAQDESSAIEKADELSADIEPYPNQEDFDMHSWINAPANNSHIGFSTWNRNFVVVTAVGPIALRVENYGPFSSDGLWEVQTIVAFANLQIAKLKGANVIP